MIAAAVLAIGVGTGAVIDVRTRRIPNPVVGSIAVAGLGLALAGITDVSVVSSLAGSITGIVLMLPLHRYGATGAGDVKLFAAAAAVLGVRRVPLAWLLTLLAGGVAALVLAVRRGRFRATCGCLLALVRAPAAARRAIEQQSVDNRFPYGPAIAAGVTLAALVSG